MCAFIGLALTMCLVFILWSKFQLTVDKATVPDDVINSCRIWPDECPTVTGFLSGFKHFPVLQNKKLIIIEQRRVFYLKEIVERK